MEAEDTSGVPLAEFIDDIGQLMKGHTVEEIITELQTNIQKYKFIEAQLIQRRTRTKAKLPELQKALDIVELLISKQGSGEGVTLDYALADQVFAKAKVDDVQHVNLWLGAGVMVEYTLEDAKEVLTSNISRSKANLEINQRDLDLMRNNITTTEVTCARVYNFDVERRRQQKEGAK
jgi:prefoldin subunit 5